MSNEIEQQMHDRLANGLDPITGEQRETVGKISRRDGVCRDETGREVTLSDKGTWVYA